MDNFLQTLHPQLSHTVVIATQYPVHTQKKIIATAPYLNTVTKEEFTHMTQFYSPPKKSIYLFQTIARVGVFFFSKKKSPVQPMIVLNYLFTAQPKDRFDL